MIQSFDSSNSPDLATFPSALSQEQHLDVLPAKRGFGTKLIWLVVRLIIVLAVILALLAGFAYYFISSGPVSNEQVRLQVEGQLNALLGEGHTARIGEAKIAVGNGGLLALDASDVKILAGEHVNLGVASDLAVSIKAMPLLKGEVIAETVSLSNAAISLDSLWQQVEGSPATATKGWPKTLNVKSKMTELYGMLEMILTSVERAGVDKVSLENTKIVGFDGLGLQSNSARLIYFVAEKDVRFQTGLFFEGELETPRSNWTIEGHWKEADAGGKVLAVEFGGLQLNEFLPDGPKGEFYIDSTAVLKAVVPYDENGNPGDANIALELSEGSLKVGKHYQSRVLSALFNWTVLTEKNQLEMNPSSVRFPDAKMTLLGGVRYPRDDGGTDTSNGVPIFEFIANDIKSVALDRRKPEVDASLIISGTVTPEEEKLVATNIALTTRSGVISGTGATSFDGETPSLELDLKLPEMEVETFKQLWPPFLAAKARIWSRDNLTGGKVSNAWVKANIPTGILGRLDLGAKLKPSHLKASLPISGSAVKSIGDVPMISKAKGKIFQKGMESEITLDAGLVKFKSGRTVSVRRGKMQLGDFELEPIPAKLQISVDGAAAAMAELGTFKPLNFTKEIGVSPKDLSGKVSANVDATFGIAKDSKFKNVKWSGNLALADVSSAVPIDGRKLSKAKLKVKVTPGTAKITGSAHLDGVPAKIALLEKFGSGKGNSKRSVTVTLSDKDRKKLGFDTSAFMAGPVDVTITTGKSGVQHFDADLTKTKLDFPWIHWRKGTGIVATASFDLETRKKSSRLTNFVLRGKGFGAKGSMVLDSSGLISANLKRVRLNKGDDFDVTTKRLSDGIEVAVKARSYDGRAIIRSFIENKSDDAAAKSKQRVVVKATVDKLLGFGGQSLNGLSLNYTQRGGRVKSASAKAVAAGGAPTTFSMKPSGNKMKTILRSSNAGAVLRFLDIYSKVRGGALTAELESADSKTYIGSVSAENFQLLNEPRLGELLKPASKASAASDREGTQVVAKKSKKIDPRKVQVKWLTAHVKMASKYLEIRKGRLRGGDAGAAFDGVVYDRRNRTNLTGTYLPAYGLNKAVSKIPLIGLAFGDGRKRGLIGVTFKMTGNYSNPDLIVNPISLIAPGVFRKLFEF